MLLVDFRRHPNPLVWAELYSVRLVKPVSLRKHIEVIFDLGLDTWSKLLMNILRDNDFGCRLEPIGTGWDLG